MLSFTKRVQGGRGRATHAIFPQQGFCWVHQGFRMYSVSYEAIENKAIRSIIAAATDQDLLQRKVEVWQ